MADYNLEEKAIKETTVSDLVSEAHKIISEIEDTLNISMPKNGQSTEPFGKIALLGDAVKCLNGRLVDVLQNLRKL